MERGQGSAKLPRSVQNVPLRLVPVAEQAAASVWVANWLRMIPVINATRDAQPKALCRFPFKLSLSLFHAVTESLRRSPVSRASEQERTLT